MMRDEMGDADPNGRGVDAVDEMTEASEPLVSALAADGARWRAEQGGAASAIERRLRASLQAKSAEPVRQRGRARAGDTQRTPAWVAAGAAAMVLLGLVGTLYALRGGTLLPGVSWNPFGPQPSRINTGPPPRYIIPTGPVDAGATPQQAFAQGYKLTPCQHDPGATSGGAAPPKTAAITWLYARPNFGIVNIQVTCQTQARPVWLWVLGLARHADGSWGIQGGEVYINQNPFHTEPNAVPAWLELPPGAYDHEEVFNPYPAAPNDPPTASVVVWLSQTRMYYLGHVSASEPRPDGATTITVNGQPGWVVQQNGMVTVTVPLADGTTAFFSGTGSLAEIEALTPVAFAHMDEALSPLLPVGNGQTPSP